MQSLVAPSGSLGVHSRPKPVHSTSLSGADRLNPDDEAVTSAVVEPAVAVAVMEIGVSPVAHTQVSYPTRVAPLSPSRGLVSTVGAGIVIASIAARARTLPGIGGVGGWEIIKAKPSAAKGKYLRTVTVASTMGPGVKVNPDKFDA